MNTQPKPAAHNQEERLLSKSVATSHKGSSDSGFFSHFLPRAAAQNANIDASRIIQEASGVPLHSDHVYRRLLDRRGLFNQSNGNWRVRRQMDPAVWRSLYTLDPFHSLVTRIERQ